MRLVIDNNSIFLTSNENNSLPRSSVQLNNTLANKSPNLAIYFLEPSITDASNHLSNREHSTSYHSNNNDNATTINNKSVRNSKRSNTLCAPTAPPPPYCP